jgi:hypothetical protein
MAHVWKELHNRAIIHPRGQNDTQFLTIWANKIPNFEGGCKCRSFYVLWKARNPPNFSDYFTWTVNLHNAVNAKLGKPSMTVEVARRLYQNP